MARKRALITGITGQDGPYLAKLLLSKGYKVFGTYRRISTPNFWRLQQLGIVKHVTLIPADLSDMASLLEAVTLADPHEIYNLAAQSFVGASFDQPLLTAEIDGIGATRFLEIIRHLRKDIKFYQASTSELYGATRQVPQDENTPMAPNSPYAAAKLYSFHTTRIYRHSYGIFASNGILFNHESPLRGLEFVTRKITNSVAKIKLGIQKELHLGNIDSRRDWGYAPEFVHAMWLMMQQRVPDDFVVATGETHSVAEFAEQSFNAVGLNFKDYVVLDQRLKRPLDVRQLCGNPEKAKKVLKWKPKVTFQQLVRIMIQSDLKRWKMYLNGKIFPWDAPNYSHELDTVSRNVLRDVREVASQKANLLRRLKR
jgi:GDPmannose 4,6-dehydratase